MYWLIIVDKDEKGQARNKQVAHTESIHRARALAIEYAPTSVTKVCRIVQPKSDGHIVEVGRFEGFDRKI